MFVPPVVHKYGSTTVNCYSNQVMQSQVELSFLLTTSVIIARCVSLNSILVDNTESVGHLSLIQHKKLHSDRPTDYNTKSITVGTCVQ